MKRIGEACLWILYLPLLPYFIAEFSVFVAMLMLWRLAREASRALDRSEKYRKRWER